VYRSKMEEGIRKYSEMHHLDEVKIRNFLNLLHFHSMDPEMESEYPTLKKVIGDLTIEAELPGNCLFYLSLPPGKFAAVAQNLGKTGLNKEHHGYKRLIVEKPFGYDLQ
jgi:glucose-6-phosphate 1-dehydrogenase